MATYPSITARGARTGRARAALLAVSSLALAALSVLPPAQAVVPSNDTPAGAPLVTSTPYTQTVDTTEATADPGMGQFRFHGVWYRLRLPNDGRVFVTLRGSDFTEQMVRMFHTDTWTTPSTDWTFVRDARYGTPDDPSRFVARVQGGARYYLLVGTDSDGPGGLAKLTIRRPARVTFGLAKFGQYGRIDGSAILKGTFNATRPARVYLSTELRQVVGHQIASGWGGRNFTIPAGSTAWSMKVAGDTGPAFRAGLARIRNDYIRVSDDGVDLGTTYHFGRRLVTLR